VVAVYVSWWTAALLTAAVLSLIAAVVLWQGRRRPGIAFLALGLVLVGGYLAADFIGPGHRFSTDSSEGTTEIYWKGTIYASGGYPCRSAEQMRSRGVYPGALRLAEPLVPVGHVSGWFGGPRVLMESGKIDSGGPLYLEVKHDCYEFYGGINA
jgi:hypothetical protein